MSRPDPSPTPEPPRWKRPRFWLFVMVIAFFVVSSWAGVACYSNFQFANNTDAGIITQAVSSTTYQRYAPFFESYDCMVKTRCSFLLVHPAFVLYGAVPFYAAAPSTITLFVLRSALVAISAIPLYWLTRRVTGSPTKALVAAGLFLIWAPGFLGDAFSLHLETIIPLVLFTLAALWVFGRYRLGLAVAAIGFLTIEVVPIFTFLVGVFFLTPLIARAIQGHWRSWQSSPSETRTFRSAFASWYRTGRAALALREVQYTLALMGMSIAGYILLLSFMNVWGPHLLGVIPPYVPAGASKVFYNNSSPGIASIGTILSSQQTIYTAEFWLILYATLAFIPLLCPRALILSVPWIGWTFLTDSSRFTTIGHQYTMIAAGPLFIGLAYGLAWMPPRTAFLWYERRTPSTATPEDPVPAKAAPGARRRGSRAYRGVWAGALGAVVVANLLLSPVNPLLPDVGYSPGVVFESGYFDHSLEWNPSVEYVESMIAKIPQNATVTAPASIFPLVANYPKAFVLVPPDRLNISNLPFNTSAPPEYVLINPADFGALSVDFRNNLTNPSLYGVRGYVASTALGPILLYEEGYSGPAEEFGPNIGPASASFVPGSGLAAGASGHTSTNDLLGLKVIVGNGGAIGVVAYTGVTFVPAAPYTVSVLLSVTPDHRDLPTNTTAVSIIGRGYGGVPLNLTYALGQFPSENFTTLAENLTVPVTLPDFYVIVVADSPHVTIAIRSVVLTPD